jgi:hypothetical protein
MNTAVDMVISERLGEALGPPVQAGIVSRHIAKVVLKSVKWRKAQLFRKATAKWKVRE